MVEPDGQTVNTTVQNLELRMADSIDLNDNSLPTTTEADLSPEGKARIRDLFEKIDMDGQGYVSLNNLFFLFSPLFEATQISDTEGLEMLATCTGMRPDKSIDLEEFEGIVKQKLMTDGFRPLIPLALKAVDGNKDGFVDEKDLAGIWSEGMALTKGDIKPELVDKFDSDGDGKLNQEEFETMVLFKVKKMFLKEAVTSRGTGTGDTSDILL